MSLSTNKPTILELLAMYFNPSRSILFGQNPMHQVNKTVLGQHLILPFTFFFYFSQNMLSLDHQNKFQD